MAARDITPAAHARPAGWSDRRRRQHQALLWREIRRLAGGEHALEPAGDSTDQRGAREPADGIGSA